MGVQNRGTLPASSHELAEFGQLGGGGGGSYPVPAIGQLSPTAGGAFPWIQQPTTNGNSNNYPSGMLLLAPFWLPPGTYDAVSFNVTTAGSAGSTTRAVGYTVDATTTQPGTLLFDSGAIDTTTTGAKVVTGLSIVAPAGGLLLWAGAVNQGAPTTTARLSTSGGAYIAHVFSSPPGSPTAGWDIYQLNGVSAAAPTTLSGGGRIFDQAYAVAFRRSA